MSHKPARYRVRWTRPALKALAKLFNDPANSRQQVPFHA